MIDNMKELNVQSVWRTCNKIRTALSRIRLNLWKCYTPLDIQQRHVIPESDFISVLTGPVGKIIGLSNQEICEVTDYFRTQDGRIYYAQFCAIIHEGSPNFEKNEPFVSGMEWEDPLHTNCVSTSEQRRLEVIITKIATHVNRRNLVLKPYFQDYELISKNCGTVTFAHFARVLHFLDITLASEEMHLMIKKFAKDNYTMNYVAFLQAVEEAQHFFKKHGVFDKGGDLLDKFPGRVVSVKLPKLPRPEVGKIKTACVFPRQLHFLPVDTSSKRIRGIEEIMLRIQEHVYKNQIPVAHYFEDFDIFNVGRITENSFRRGLDALERSALGKLYLAEEEFQTLAAFYKDPNDMERICWRTFEDDVEQVFTIKELQKHPNCKVAMEPVEVKKLPRKGYKEWECAKTFDKEKIETISKKTLQKIAHQTKGRRLHLKKFFQDFDRNNRGHVTRAQMRRVFTVTAIPLTVEELSSLEYKYNNDLGFHYVDFINKLEQLMNRSLFPDKEQSENKTNISSLPGKSHVSEEKDIDMILAKVKAKVVCNGIKVNEFLRKFDRLNEKVITRPQFDQGVDKLKINLTCTELNTLMDHYANNKRPDYVDYWKFSEEVEGARAQAHLEKSPLAKPVQHVPSEATPRCFLNYEERQILMRTLNVLCAYADSNMEDVFKDFDKQTNTGNVSKSQLMRVFTLRKVFTVINANEFEVLFKSFSTGHVKGEPRFSYRNFLNALYIIRANKVYVP